MNITSNITVQYNKYYNNMHIHTYRAEMLYFKEDIVKSM